MTTPTNLPTNITPDVTVGHDTDTEIVHAAVNALTAAAALPKSASDLTTGTLSPDRIGNASITAAKLAFDVATQAELNAAIVGAGGTTDAGALTGTLSAARIADESLPLTKLSVQVVPQATLNAAIATRAPLVHTHSAADINSGTLSPTRIGLGSIALTHLAPDVTARLDNGGGVLVPTLIDGGNATTDFTHFIDGGSATA